MKFHYQTLNDGQLMQEFPEVDWSKPLRAVDLPRRPADEVLYFCRFCLARLNGIVGLAREDVSLPQYLMLMPSSDIEKLGWSREDFCRDHIQSIHSPENPAPKVYEPHPQAFVDEIAGQCEKQFNEYRFSAIRSGEDLVQWLLAKWIEARRESSIQSRQ